MISTGFKQENLNQMIPEQIQNNNYRSDVIQSRVVRRILPTGTNQDIGPNASVSIEFKTSREWVDASTARVHMKVVVPEASNGTAAPTPNCPQFKPGGARNIIKGYNIVSKGQSLENSVDSGTSALQHWNWLQSRLFEPLEKNITSAQLTTGAWAVQNKNYYYNSGRISGGEVIYDLSFPLSDVVQFFKLKRCYLPFFAIPIDLKIETNSSGNVFFNQSAAGTATEIAEYKIKDLYITADFLEMDDALNNEFMKSVNNGSVSFIYPSVYLKSGTISSGTLADKSSLNFSNVQSAFISFTDVSNKINNYYPACCVPSLYDVKTLQGVNYNMYIDSVPVLSQYINTPSEHYAELIKCCKNEREKYLESTPNISTLGFLNGNTSTNVTNRVEDIACNPIGINLSRELNNFSLSGVDLTSVAGNIDLDISGIPGGAQKSWVLAFHLIKELRLEKEMLRVIN
ncbi:MAG: hypothetical protein H6630_08955 [Arcobacter sp.]|nr:hypothetical protein [Arcobacter sp.]